MWKWLLIITTPIVLLIGGVAWYITRDAGDLPQQAAQAPTAATPDDASPTLAPNQRPRPASKGPGWALNCRSAAQEQGLSCRLSQRVVQRGSGLLLTQVTFFLPPKNQDGGRFSIQLPLGVSLQGGASLRVDENAPQNLRIRTCDRRGCYIEGQLSPQLLVQLRKGNALTVAFKNQGQDTISLPLSLSGFEEALAKAKNV